MPSEKDRNPKAPRWSVEQAVTLAVVWEVSAPKPGNVHRGADFDDATFYDFLTGAVAIAPTLGQAAELGLGRAVYEAVRATQQAVGTNTNLGTVLLLAPLAMVPESTPLETGVGDVLADLTADDSRWVYEAIRLSQPGGLGTAAAHDVHDAAPDDLLAAMRVAEKHDLVARQYAHGFQQVLGEVVPWIVDARAAGRTLIEAIVETQLRLMSTYPDSLIARKAGHEIAKQAAARAEQVLDQRSLGSEAYHRALAEFDFWLRADGRRRNPGTSADLLAAGLFVGLREGIINAPFVFSPSSDRA